MLDQLMLNKGFFYRVTDKKGILPDRYEMTITDAKEYMNLWPSNHFLLYSLLRKKELKD